MMAMPVVLSGAGVLAVELDVSGVLVVATSLPAAEVVSAPAVPGLLPAVIVTPDAVTVDPMDVVLSVELALIATVVVLVSGLTAADTPFIVSFSPCQHASQNCCQQIKYANQHQVILCQTKIRECECLRKFDTVKSA